MRLETKAIKGGILLGTFALISFLAMMHFLFDSIKIVFVSEIIYFFLIACILNYLVSIGTSAFCLKSIRRGRNPKLIRNGYREYIPAVISSVFIAHIISNSSISRYGIICFERFCIYVRTKVFWFGPICPG